MKLHYFAAALMVTFSSSLPAEESFTITSTEEQNRIYLQATDIIQPFLRLHGKPEKEVTPEAAVQLHRAVRMLDAVTGHQPDNWAAFWMIGKAQQALDDTNAARSAFKKAFDLHDQNPDVAREYMFECLKVGDATEGLRAARQAVKLQPENAGLQANLCLALLIAGQTKDALAAIDESLRLDSTDKISQTVRRITLEIIDGKRAAPKKMSDLGN